MRGPELRLAVHRNVEMALCSTDAHVLSSADQHKNVTMSCGQQRDEVIEVGAMFGDLCMFPDICKYRTETVVTQSVCIVHKLPLDAFQELAAKHPEFGRKVRSQNATRDP